jgi:hypothetical protein
MPRPSPSTVVKQDVNVDGGDWKFFVIGRYRFGGFCNPIQDKLTQSRRWRRIELDGDVAAANLQMLIIAGAGVAGHDERQQTGSHSSGRHFSLGLN